MKKIFFLLLILLFNLFFISQKVEANENINVVYTIDKNYPIIASLSINSILKNNSSNSDYHFFIIDTDLSEKDRELMRDFVEKNNQKISFIKLDLNSFDKGHNFFANGHWNGRLNNTAIVRILVAELLPRDVKRVIYLDADTLIMEDLSVLWDYNLEDKTVGMVKDLMHPQYDFHKFKTYYNTGVMLINLDLWRQKGFGEQMVNYINNNIERFIPNKNPGTFFSFSDQDLINVVLENNIKPLPNKFNSYNSYCYHGERETAVIIHYIGEKKPWIYFRGLLIDKIYYKYWDESEFKQYKNYYKYYKRWKWIFRGMYKDFYSLNPQLVLKILLQPLRAICEICFFSLPIVIPYLLVVFAQSFRQRDFKKFSKHYLILFSIISLALYSLFWDFYLVKYSYISRESVITLIVSIFLLIYINLLIRYLSRKNRQKWYLLLLFALISYFVYVAVKLWN